MGSTRKLLFLGILEMRIAEVILLLLGCSFRYQSLNDVGRDQEEGQMIRGDFSLRSLKNTILWTPKVKSHPNKFHKYRRMVEPFSTPS